MFDRAALQAVLVAQGPVARVVIAGVEGSSPREVGASMLVWAGGSSGTIGGGALEWQALAAARGMLASGKPLFPPGEAEAHASPLGGESRGGGAVRSLDRVALGPSLGQCCGGAVTLLTEVFTSADVLPQDIFARSLDGRPMPLAVKRLLDRARAQGILPRPVLLQGWFVEPVARPSRHLWIWGAGHVGRAIVGVMAPLPGLAVTWIDVGADRFPADIPTGVTAVPAAEPGLLVPHVPATAEHLVLTYSHALDLELCHRLLGHDFARLGLIGSTTKWVRFRSRLAALGHAPASIARITCPIGEPALGKHPQAIAIGIAADFLSARAPALHQEKLA